MSLGRPRRRRRDRRNCDRRRGLATEAHPDPDEAHQKEGLSECGDDQAEEHEPGVAGFRVSRTEVAAVAVELSSWPRRTHDAAADCEEDDSNPDAVSDLAVGLVWCHAGRSIPLPTALFSILATTVTAERSLVTLSATDSPRRRSDPPNPHGRQPSTSTTQHDRAMARRCQGRSVRPRVWATDSITSLQSMLPLGQERASAVRVARSTSTRCAGALPPARLLECNESIAEGRHA